ncbi:Fur family transcriptional regulator [Anaerotalea alkaliphila]|uniref:Transcriptional repressor n=1 Tax=Anaerotalea alkaliphila TaxID=2662126 RepID=A0A7X5HXG3_9FIRM|nr:transcriptional repressor [Anaerotalea alkaliphila]NDL68391.1 transcriptional repressor [Anaerotalea alkaliphila]
MNTDQIGGFLHEKGVKPSFQRIKVYEYLMNNKEHPTVENIYRDLIKEIPTLSKTTVYNSLNTFIEKGVVQAISIDGNEMRYDLYERRHGHFKCEVCGRIYDFLPPKEAYEELEALEGFLITDRQIYLKGVCKNCR